MAKKTPTVQDDLDVLRREMSEEAGVDLYWGDDKEHELHTLPLGLASVDRALSGGFAFNRITLIVGEEQNGKTLLALAAIKAAQAQGYPTVFIDVERAWTAQWARAVGVDPSRVIVADPPNGEKAFDAAAAVVKRPGPGVVVIDSIAAMPPAAELEASAEKQFMGSQARMVNRGIRDLNAVNNGWMILLINQLREKVGITYGSPIVYPAGKGQKYYAHQIIRVLRGPTIEEGSGKTKRIVGRVIKLRVDKNKQGAPFAEAEVPFHFTGEFDEISGLVDLAIEFGIIKGNSGYYEFDGEKYHGRRALREMFEEPERRDVLQAALDAVPEEEF